MFNWLDVRINDTSKYTVTGTFSLMFSRAVFRVLTTRYWFSTSNDFNNVSYRISAKTLSSTTIHFYPAGTHAAYILAIGV